MLPSLKESKIAKNGNESVIFYENQKLLGLSPKIFIKITLLRAFSLDFFIFSSAVYNELHLYK